MCKLWSDILHLNPIGIHDTFFDLGGNSILAAKMLIQLERFLEKNTSAPSRHIRASLQANGLRNS
ncbi:phosphopantetheine-binding protein [Paenibacillus amylolyticus]|uniref:phosphopantetheine-binding protein n=1 Tax=Paenibacillus amylolyticus TaxID=1451 RepID=UPI003EC09F86